MLFANVATDPPEIQMLLQALVESSEGLLPHLRKHNHGGTGVEVMALLHKPAAPTSRRAALLHYGDPVATMGQPSSGCQAAKAGADHQD